MDGRGALVIRLCALYVEPSTRYLVAKHLLQTLDADSNGFDHLDDCGGVPDLAHNEGNDFGEP